MHSCTELHLEVAEMLDYYACRWTIEVYFRDCEQLSGLGKGQSETFDAVVSRVSIVMIRYLLLVYILAKRQTACPMGTLFRQLVYEHLQIAMIQTLWTRMRQIFVRSSQLIWTASESGKIAYFVDLIEE